MITALIYYSDTFFFASRSITLPLPRYRLHYALAIQQITGPYRWNHRTNSSKDKLQQVFCLVQCINYLTKQRSIAIKHNYLLSSMLFTFSNALAKRKKLSLKGAIILRGYVVLGCSSSEKESWLPQVL